MAEGASPIEVAATALFVELLVIGSGTAGALAPILGACIGWDWVDHAAHAGPLFVFLVAGIYVLGIVTDRLADAMGEPFADRWRSRVYPGNESPARDYDVDLLTVLLITPLASRLAYGRSRLRVCRGWTVNCVIGGLTFLGYVIGRRGLEHRLALGLAVEAAIIVLGAGCAFAWRQLAKAQDYHVRRQSVIRQNPAGG